MKIEELETKLAEDEKKAAANRELAQRWLGGHNTGVVAVQRSLFCQRNSHASCNWAECKCVCHDEIIDSWGHC